MVTYNREAIEEAGGHKNNSNKYKDEKGIPRRRGYENVSPPTMMLRRPQSQAVNSLGQFGAGTLDDTLR